MKTALKTPRLQIMRKNWGVFLGYSLLSLLMTYPLIFKINKVLMVKTNVVPGADANLYLWFMWWTRKALLNFQNPFYTDMLFYPTGGSLLWTELSLLNMLISLPLQFFFSRITIHNMLFLLSFPLAGWGTYLLLVYLTKDKVASFIGGCIFAFTPFHFVRDCHLCYLSIQWIPFFVLYFLKFFRIRRIKHAVLAGVFLGCIALSALTYMVFVLFFVFLFVIYKLKKDRRLILNKYYIKCFVIFILIFAFFVTPVLGPMMVENIRGGGSNVSSLDISVICSADLAAFFVPSPLHPFFEKVVTRFYERIWTYDGRRFGNNAVSTVFLGYLVIFLLIYNVRAVQFKDKRFWWFVCLCFFILTLGPALKIAGLITIPIRGLNLDKLALRVDPALGPVALEMLKDRIGIPLPFIIWHFIPLVNFIRVPTNFFILGILSTSILCSYSMALLFKKCGDKKLGVLPKKHLLASIFLIIILFEYLALPLDYVRLEVPEFYREIAEDGQEYAIVDLPLANHWAATIGYTKLHQYYQTAHRKKLITGSIGHDQKGLFDFISENPFLNSLTQPATSELKSLKLPRQFLLENRLKYFILHKKHFDSNIEYSKLKEYFTEQVGKACYLDDDIEVYKIY